MLRFNEFVNEKFQKSMSYAVELINPEEKDRLYETYGSQLLYTSKAEIYGCCMKILTDSEATQNKWEDNFFSANENNRSHGRLIVLSQPGQPFSIKYDPYTKTAFLINVDYYGWVKSIALSVAGDILEDEHRIYSVHGAMIEVDRLGVSIIAMGAAPTEIKTDRYDFLTYHPTTLFLPLQVGRTDEKGFALRFDFGSSLGFAEQVKTIVRSGTGTWVKEYSPHSNYVPWPGEHGGSGGGVVELCPYVYTSLCGDSYSWLSKKESYSSVINETTIISHIDTTKGILMGRICNDVNTNGNCEDTETFTGLNDASGDAIPDVSITNGTNTWSAYAREEFGTWAIGNLPAGTYTITYPSQIVSSGRTYYLKTPPLTVTLFPVCSSTGMPSNLCAVSWSGYNDAAYGPSSDCRKIQVVYFQDYNANGERDATFWTDENGNSYTGVLEPAIAGMKVSVTDISDVLHPLSMGIFETGSDGSFYVDQGIYQGNTYRITPIDIPVTQNVRYQFTTGDPLLPNNPIDHMVGP